MSNVKKHLFGNQAKVPIFKAKSSDEIIGYVTKGQWMGMLNEGKERFLIISTNVIGWVPKQLCDARDSNSIKIDIKAGNPAYFID